MRGPASSSGSSTSFRVRVNSATRPGKTTRGGGRVTSRPGRRSLPIRSWGSSTFRRTEPRSITTAASIPETIFFGTSLLALDVETGERAWHFQLVHHDIWNYDTPTAPILMDVTVDGRADLRGLPGHQAVFRLRVQPGAPASRSGPSRNCRYLNPGCPVSSSLLRNRSRPNRRRSTSRGETQEQLIDYTPEIKRRAMEVALENNLFVPLFDPPTYVGDLELVVPARACPGGGGGGEHYRTACRRSGGGRDLYQLPKRMLHDPSRTGVGLPIGRTRADGDYPLRLFASDRRGSPRPERRPWMASQSGGGRSGGSRRSI